MDDDGNGDDATDNYDDDDNNGEDNDVAAADDDDVNVDNDDVDDVDDDNLPPHVGKRNDGCNKTKTRRRRWLQSMWQYTQQSNSFCGGGGSRR